VTQLVKGGLLISAQVLISGPCLRLSTRHGVYLRFSLSLSPSSFAPFPCWAHTLSLSKKGKKKVQHGNGVETLQWRIPTNATAAGDQHQLQQSF